MSTANTAQLLTPWFPHSTKPAHIGEYECAVQISSSVPLLLMRLMWGGTGFIVPVPMVVKYWRGLSSDPSGKGERCFQ